MALAREVPLLADLPKMEQAKLLADLEDLTFAADEIIFTAEDAPSWLYFVLEGEVELSAVSEHGTVTPVAVIEAGNPFGELGLFEKRYSKQQAKAATAVKVCRLSLQRFRRLVDADAAFAQKVSALIAGRMSQTLSELARTKQMLTAYADEVWSTVPQPVEAAAEMSEASEPSAALSPDRLPSRVARRNAGSAVTARSPWLTWGGALFGIAAGLLAYSFTPGTRQLAAVSGILVWAACSWMLGTIPDYVTALLAAIMSVMAAAVKPAVAFSGFASPSWFLLLGVLGIGVAVAKSGLLYRIALHMLRLFPPHYEGQSLALAVTGVLFTPLLPSANSRAAMVSPLVRELSDAMRFPALGRGSAGLGMSSFLGFGQMYFLFLNTNTCMLAWSLLPEAAKQEASWLRWLWLTLPMGIILFAGSYAAIRHLFKPEANTGISRETIVTQLQVLGPMNRSEKITLCILGIVLAGFMTESFHGVDPGWLSLGGFLALICMNVVDKNGLKAIDWGFLLLVGPLMGLSEVTKVTGFGAQLTQWLLPGLKLIGPSPYLFLGCIALLTVILRMAVPIQQAVLVLVIALLPVAVQLGYDPTIVAVVVLALSSSWLVPQQNTVYVTIHAGTEERCFSHQQVRPLAFAQAILGVTAVLASVPFWKLLGLLPR